MSKAKKPRALTCNRVWPRHHEWRTRLWWVWNGSLRWVTWRLWCSCWCVGLLLLLVVCPGRGVGWCCCGTVGVFFSHRRAGVCPHTLCQAMAPAAPQAAILTPFQAGATAVIILRRTSDGGWEEMKTESNLEQAREVRWGKEARNVMFFVCFYSLPLSTLSTTWIGLLDLLTCLLIISWESFLYYETKFTLKHLKNTKVEWRISIESFFRIDRCFVTMSTNPLIPQASHPI